MLGRYHYSILKINSDKNKLDDDKYPTILQESSISNKIEFYLNQNNDFRVKITLNNNDAPIYGTLVERTEWET